MEIDFYKYHGAGNDFVILDNREKEYDSIKEQQAITGICHRRFGIGADGVMMIENDPHYDFRMIYFNADGKEGSLCGNGGRCIIALAFKLGIINKQAQFMASDGLHLAEVVNPDYVNLKMLDVSIINVFDDHMELNTGSPHYIKVVPDLTNYPVYASGHKIRYSSNYPNGINVNFIENMGDHWAIRTYERGVEDETWACGTGATAAALCSVEIEKDFSKSIVNLKAKGGDLTVKFDRKGPGYFENIWLCGGAKFIYQGNYNI
ncbi:MAG: diaminopimelate epimerase [Saprospiraceae bacterium]